MTAMRAAATAFLMIAAQAAGAQEAPGGGGTLDLQKKAQNPIADLISVPVQADFNGGYGAKAAPEPSSTQFVLNLQPVVPLKIAPDLNLITRPIIPIIRQPDLIEGGDNWGLGDIQLQTYLSPRTPLPGGLIFGAGPVIQAPTATNGRKIGTQKWSAGPAAVGLVMPGRWVVGALASNLWSFAGDNDREDINLTTIQPFINYNFEEGWYVSTSPIITANWKAEGSDNVWTVPLGGGFGRLIRLGKLPVNFQVQAFRNVVKPDDDATADWTLRLQVQFLFPE